MSRKWQRNKAWEDQNLVGPLTPVRWVLRVFSGIPLAVVLLTFISIYCALASIPVGLLASIPTWAIIALSVLVAALVPAALAVVVVRWVVPPASRGARFSLSMLAGLGLAAAGVGAWLRFVWPALHYDPATGDGLLLFRSFIAEYESVTVRRLPGMEMTETQFYAWWPMRLALVLFVVNMVTATVRRIEFTFKNLGVLSVHSGIVLIAVGSVFYQKFKQEGDTLVPAPGLGERVGPPQGVFYDREDVVLYAGQHTGPTGQVRLEQRLLKDLPRYNNYNLRAGVEGVDGELFSERGSHPGHAHDADSIRPSERLAMSDSGRTLDQAVPGSDPRQTLLYVDPDIRFRVVGYAPYARMQTDWVRSQPTRNPASDNPMRVVELYAFNVPNADLPPDGKLFEFPFFLNDPAQRVRANEMVAMEFTRGMDGARWADLSERLPVAASHALVVEVPGADFRAVVPARVGNEFTLGDTGWTVAVQDLAEEPPFPIITPGYEGASSSVAILRLTPPPSADGVRPEPIERWVFHRFPELNQDLSTTVDPTLGRPMRGKPDERVRVAYLDMSRLQVYLDERPDGSVRTIVRQPGGEVRVADGTEDSWIRDLVPNPEGATVDLKLGERWAHARKIERPVPVPVAERDISLMGSHTEAFVAVEISADQLGGREAWSDVVWLPFTKYMGIQRDTAKRVVLPDGRDLQIAFGRLQRPFPDFTVSMVDFEMVSYDHRGAPRDYQSTVRVAPRLVATEGGRGFTAYEHLIKLNEPLRAPFHWDPEANILSNFFRRLGAGLNPNQFKLSQAGWDRAGWQETQRLTDLGQAPGPRVNFTILGVGNNPGIHVIAFGSVLMGVGIPWAFYLKPWMVRREKERLAKAVREGTIKTPKQRAAAQAGAEVPA